MKHAITLILTLLILTPFATAAEPANPASFTNKVFAVANDGEAFNSDQFSVAAWVKYNDKNQTQTFLSRSDAPRLFTLYLMASNGDPHIRMLVEYEAGKYTQAVCVAPEAGEWHHYLGTYDGKQIKLYLDGKPVASKNAPGRILPSGDPLCIGGLPDGQRYLDGQMADIRFWNRVLLPEEVEETMAGEVVEQGLVAKWTGENFQPKENITWKSVGPIPLLAKTKISTVTPPAVPKPEPKFVKTKPLDGFRGIWYYNQKQNNEYVYKYSGGLGTYCAKHIPFAVYAPKVNKTFFVYGGTDAKNSTLLHMISYYDHESGMVARPRLIMDKKTDDAHDNPVLNIDEDGYLWVFSSSHGTGRPSYLWRSTKPYSIDEFEMTWKTNFSYVQPHLLPGKGCLFLHTRYGGGKHPNGPSARNSYMISSPDYRQWSEPKRLTSIEEGSYQVSWSFKDKVGTTFNMHPKGKGLNWRTNLYYMETEDFGETWKTADGKVLELPLTEADNPALVTDYQSQGLNVYMKDLAFDSKGNPIILVITSKGWESGPDNNPRTWTTVRWTGSEWETNGSITSDNNYDMGSLQIITDTNWRLVGPTQTGPQPYNPGGEVAMWVTEDGGKTWTMEKELTKNSPYNHTYCRKVVNGHPDFFVFWADGHGRQPSESRLYFTNQAGDHVWRLPQTMTEDFAKPEVVE